jgi:hypothetical protein
MTDSSENSLENNPADSADDSANYVPVFSPKIRTFIYVFGLVASIVGLGFLTFGDASVAAFISTAAGVVASGFGVAYNPSRGVDGMK